jgi:hypothetical protein
MSLKSQILFLRKEGFTYTEICKQLNCSRGTVSYHCSETVKLNYHERRRNYARKFVDNLKGERGGRCEVCSYDKCLAALEWHHRDPKEKDGAVLELARTSSYKRARKESEKCDLVCANCHREIHHAII